MVEKNFIFV